MTPIIQSIYPKTEQYNMMSAGLVMGIMILPMVASLSEDALRAVPDSLRQASFGIGATKFETTIKIVFPASLSGVIAALILAISRAVGETMIVAIAAGAGPKWTANPFIGAQTMTGYIAAISQGETSFGTPDYNSIFAIGLTLFIMTLVLNILSRMLVARFREVY
jgi:phosphate transport system permease protein